MSDITVFGIVQIMLMRGTYCCSVPDGGVLAARLAPSLPDEAFLADRWGRLDACGPLERQVGPSGARFPRGSPFAAWLAPLTARWAPLKVKRVDFGCTSTSIGPVSLIGEVNDPGAPSEADQRVHGGHDPPFWATGGDTIRPQPRT